MGVSLESYRFNIGLFDLSGRNNQFKFRNHGCLSRKSKKFQFFSVFLLIFLFLHNPKSSLDLRDQNDHIRNTNLLNNPQCKSHTNPSSSKVSCGSSALSTATTDDTIKFSSWSLSWSHPIKTNKL